MHVRVEYVFDPESHNWCFRVPSLDIIGGVDTREAAEQEAIDAIAFVLESEPDLPDGGDGEVTYLQLSLQH